MKIVVFWDMMHWKFGRLFHLKYCFVLFQTRKLYIPDGCNIPCVVVPAFQMVSNEISCFCYVCSFILSLYVCFFIQFHLLKFKSPIFIRTLSV